MTAEQARKKSESVNGILASAILGRIFSSISVESEKGRKCVSYTVSGEEDSLMSAIIKHLQSLGYIVKQNRGSDYRDGNWNYLNISW
jgi:hypothetical protein